MGTLAPSPGEIIEQVRLLTSLAQSGSIGPSQYNAGLLKLAWQLAQGGAMAVAINVITTIPGVYFGEVLPEQAQRDPALAAAAEGLALGLVQNGNVDPEIWEPPQFVTAVVGQA